jgi:hypothetical protein
MFGMSSNDTIAAISFLNITNIKWYKYHTSRSLHDFKLKLTPTAFAYFFTIFHF